MSTVSMAQPYGSNEGERDGRWSQGPWSHPAFAYGPPLPVKVAMVVGGFLIFPPLGLAALAYFALRHKFGPGGWEGRGWGGHRHGRHGGHGGGCGRGRGPDRGDDDRRDREAPATGNTAFEARRREVLDKLEAERRKLAEEAKAFRDFADKERRARDAAEFNRFMAEKDAPRDNAPDATP